MMQSRLLRISSMIFFKRSSNSPRYLVPATSEPTSSVNKRLPASVSGTSPATRRCASPSTMAVLPTPCSPISAGLSPPPPPPPPPPTPPPPPPPPHPPPHPPPP